MRHSEPGKQSHRERNNVLFAISKCVSRAHQSAVQQPLIAQEVSLAGNRDQRPINATTVSSDSHLGSFGKGFKDIRVARDDFAGQPGMVDLARDRLGSADLLRRRKPLGSKLRQLSVKRSGKR
jgi:hypothetical protein